MLSGVKVLILGNSQDTGSFVREEAKRHVIIRDRLAAEFGEPVEVLVRNAWPNPGMVRYVMKAVEELQPDMVYLNVIAYPFCYESTPLRVKRIFGKVGGQKAGDVGMRIADSRKWAHNAVFRGLRRFGQATLGGDTHFSPEEVLERYEELIRVLLRREGMVVAVKGPMAPQQYGSRRGLRRQEDRRQRVHRPLKEFCAQHHVFYAGLEVPLHITRPIRKGTTVGDGLHANEEGHKDFVEMHHGPIRDAWQQHIADPDEPLTAARSGSAV